MWFTKKKKDTSPKEIIKHFVEKYPISIIEYTISNSYEAMPTTVSTKVCPYADYHQICESIDYANRIVDNLNSFAESYIYRLRVGKYAYTTFRKRDIMEVRIYKSDEEFVEVSYDLVYNDRDNFESPIRLINFEVADPYDNDIQ
jgi:hypothetical protein